MAAPWPPSLVLPLVTFFVEAGDELMGESVRSLSLIHSTGCDGSIMQICMHGGAANSIHPVECLYALAGWA